MFAQVGSRVRAVEPVLSAIARHLSTIRRWVFLIRDRKRQIRAAADLVAHELEFNADVADSIVLEGRTPATVAHGLAFHQWEKFSMTLQVINTDQPDVWIGLVATYQALQRTVAHGAMPPSGDEIRSLAATLRETEG